jgi:glycosyltransferase involved in cell wall biosynthesis
MDEPLVSICIPSYNAAASIGRCLRAVLEQNVANTEILLVDNCSTDNTLDVVRALAADRSELRIVRNESNLGRVPNWNRCLELARGKFVKFAFTNDALLPGALRCLLDAIKDDSEVVMVGSRQKTVRGMPDRLPSVPDVFEQKPLAAADALEFFARHGFAAAGSLNGLILRRSTLVANGLRFDVTVPYFSDFILALELAALGRTVLLDMESHLFDIGAQHRYHNVGQKDPSAYLAEHRICTARHMQLLEQQGRDPKVALDYLLGRYLWYLGQGWNLTVSDALRTFGGFPSLQAKVAAKTWWHGFKGSGS